MVKAEPTQSPLVLEELIDPEENAKAQARRRQFEANLKVFESKIPEIDAQYRGRFICIAGEELFVADSVEEVHRMAKVAHANDEGWFTKYIPREKCLRIYANRRHLAYV